MGTAYRDQSEPVYQRWFVIPSPVGEQYTLLPEHQSFSRKRYNAGSQRHSDNNPYDNGINYASYSNPGSQSNSSGSAEHNERRRHHPSTSSRCLYPGHLAGGLS